jgi:hypothetical protein
MAWRKIHQEHLALQRFLRKWRGQKSCKSNLRSRPELDFCQCLLGFCDNRAQAKRRERWPKRDRTQREETCSTSRQQWLGRFELYRPSQFCNSFFCVFAGADTVKLRDIDAKGQQTCLESPRAFLPKS